MAAYGFDTLVDRTGTSSAKWTLYGPDVLPFWVADMDFRAPPGLLAAVAERLDHGVLGYTRTPPELEAAFIDWLERRFGWTVVSDWLVWLPGVVPGLNLAGRAVGGDSLLIPAPVYYPFLAVPGHVDKQGIVVDLVRGRGTLGDGPGSVGGRRQAEHAADSCSATRRTRRAACTGETSWRRWRSSACGTT